MANNNGPIIIRNSFIPTFKDMHNESHLMHMDMELFTGKISPIGYFLAIYKKIIFPIFNIDIITLIIFAKKYQF